MKLATLKEGGRDGTLIMVNRELTRAVRETGVAPTLQSALDDWANLAPRLLALSEQLRDDKVPGSFELDTSALAAPLPRAYQWADGSAYVVHVELVRKAKKIDELARGYDRLAKTIRSLSGFEILSFDEPSIRKYDSLRLLKLNVRKMNLRIAAVVFENNAILVTRNARDFAQVPGLNFVDWSQ